METALFFLFFSKTKPRRQMTVTVRLHKLGCLIFRWDTESMDRLPDYMQICYEALLNVYSEIEEKVAKKGWSYRVHYGKEAVRTALLNLSLNQIIIYYLVEINYSIYKLICNDFYMYDRCITDESFSPCLLQRSQMVP